MLKQYLKSAVVAVATISVGMFFITGCGDKEETTTTEDPKKEEKKDEH